MPTTRQARFLRLLALPMALLVVGIIMTVAVTLHDNRSTAVTPSPSSGGHATSSSGVAAPLQADLIGHTDRNADRWVSSVGEPPQRLHLRLTGRQPALVEGFPVTMNDCGTRQLRVRWRALEDPVTPMLTGFTAPGAPIVAEEQGTTATMGSLLLSGCEQPAFVATTETIDDVVVEVEVCDPAVGTVPAGH